MIANILTRKAKIYQIVRGDNSQPLKRTGNITRVDELNLLGEIKCQVYNSKYVVETPAESMEEEIVNIITINDMNFNKKMIFEFEDKRYRIIEVKKYRAFDTVSVNQPIVLKGRLYGKY